MKNPGRLVKHTDGRRGIAYNRDQTRDIAAQGKAAVRFYSDAGVLATAKRLVSADKLKVVGFID